jgi:hypothetical protein
MNSQERRIQKKNPPKEKKKKLKDGSASSHLGLESGIEPPSTQWNERVHPY